MLYLGSREIADVIGVSIRKAQDLLNMFEQQGRTIHVGNRKRISIRVLSEYLCQQDGGDPKERVKEIRNFLNCT